MQNEARSRIPMKVRKAIGFHKETVISSSGDGIAQSLSSGVYGMPAWDKPLNFPRIW